METILNQVFQFLQQGVATIFHFVELVWSWSVGQISKIVEADLSCPRLCCGHCRSLQGCRGTVARRRRNLGGFCRLYCRSRQDLAQRATRRRYRLGRRVDN
jgi:hypothetical protein